ncbi:alpha/beta-hydrolase, partial [Exidia glandulosa HHB12029]
RDDLKHVKWVIPTAKTRPCSANGLAYPLRFDIHQFRDLSMGPWDDEGILESVEAIHGLIRHEIEGYNIPPNRIVLAGLSQGSAMAVWSTLTFDYAPLAGTCALAGRLPAPDLLRPRLSKHVSEHYPFFVAHCEGDPTVPLRVGSERVVKFLREVVGVRNASRNNTGLEYMLLPGRLHFIVADPAVWTLVGNWLAKVIPKIAELPPPTTSVAIS